VIQESMSLTYEPASEPLHIVDHRLLCMVQVVPELAQEVDVELREAVSPLSPPNEFR